uniref:hypothetical protein n=1 Tax=Algoriphagus sp. TaxID=1872435 RepID=UPI0040488EF1
MKKLLLPFLILMLGSANVKAQSLFWQEKLIEVDGKDAAAVAALVDGFYSKHPKPVNVMVEFSDIQMKGSSEKATHVITISSSDSKSLADYVSSLKGDTWDSYVSKMQVYMKSITTSAGKDLLSFGSDTYLPIGQGWHFKVKTEDLNNFVGAFGKLIKSIKIDGFAGVGQIIHGRENGESVYIYVTHSDLNSAFNWGPKNESEAAAFSLFSTARLGAEFTKSNTRVIVKRY